MSYNYNIEKSIVDTGLPTTYRSLDPDSPQNQQLTEAERLAAKLAMEKKLKEVQIRFDNDPKYLTKRDFGKLIELLGGAFDWLYTDPQIKDTDTDAVADIITSWDELMPDPDNKIPSAGLVWEYMTSVLLENINATSGTVESLQEELSQKHEAIEATFNNLTTLINQNVDNIRQLETTIVDNELTTSAALNDLNERLLDTIDISTIDAMFT